MGFRKISDETRRTAAAEALDGRPVAEVAVRYGVSEQSVRNWAATVLDERRRHAKGGRGGRRVAKVTLVELECQDGRVLALANVGRGGEPTGTVRAVAGAPLGAAPRALGRVRRRWVCDARALARAIAAAVANDPAAKVDQRGALRAMGVGE